MNGMRQFNGPEGQEDMAYLLGPGPVTTAQSVRLAMMADWPPDDSEFQSMVNAIRTDLLRLCQGENSHDCVLLSGTETAALADVLSTFAPAQESKTLVLSNGSIANSAAKELGRLGRPYIKLEASAFSPIKPTDIIPVLNADRKISHVWLVHSEPETGIVNSVSALAQIINAENRILMVDARLTLGALPLSLQSDKIGVLVGSSAASLESVPGLVPVMYKGGVHKTATRQPGEPVASASLHWTNLAHGGAAGSTPPTHLVAALFEALRRLQVEGGVAARLDRYHRNATALNDGMKRMGFSPLLPSETHGPFVQVFHNPKDPEFTPEIFREHLRAHSFLIARSSARTFGVGTIGDIDQRVIDRFLLAVEDTIKEMGLRSTAPAID
jgi:2-aminoethylphosphonate-pyruvate transaminase